MLHKFLYLINKSTYFHWFSEAFLWHIRQRNQYVHQNTYWYIFSHDFKQFVHDLVYIISPLRPIFNCFPKFSVWRAYGLCWPASHSQNQDKIRLFSHALIYSINLWSNLSYRIAQKLVLCSFLKFLLLLYLISEELPGKIVGSHFRSLVVLKCVWCFQKYSINILIYIPYFPLQ